MLFFPMFIVQLVSFRTGPDSVKSMSSHFFRSRDSLLFDRAINIAKFISPPGKSIFLSISNLNINLLRAIPHGPSSVSSWLTYIATCLSSWHSNYLPCSRESIFCSSTLIWETLRFTLGRLKIRTPSSISTCFRNSYSPTDDYTHDHLYYTMLPHFMYQSNYLR